MVNAVTIGNNQDYSTKIEKRNYSPQFRANGNNSLERIPSEDSFEKKDDTVKKVAIGSVIALGLAAAADGIFNHGKYLKKIFGKAEKAATETKPETKPEPKSEPKTETTNKDYESWLKEQEEAKKAVEDSNTRNTEWVEEQHKLKEEDYTNWWNKELKIIEEAKEKRIAEFKAEMDKTAIDKAVDLKCEWNDKLDIFTAIYTKGFKAISKGKKIEKLEDGSYRIITKNKNGTREIYSRNNRNITRIIYKNKDGSISHEVYFGRDQGKIGELFVYGKDGKLTDYMDFCSEINRYQGDRLCNWNRKDGNPWEDEGLNSLYMNRGRIEWNALPPKDLTNGLGLSNWTKI